MLKVGQIISECYTDSFKMLKIDDHPIIAFGQVQNMTIEHIDGHPWIRVEWGEIGHPQNDTFINIAKATHIVLKS